MFKFLTVAGLASFEMIAAIPTGFAFNLHPLTILAATIIGGLAGVFITAFLGDRVRRVISRYKNRKEVQYKDSLAHRLWRRYGIIGLGMIGTLILGAPASVAVGLSLGASTRKLVTWCCVGVITRCVLFTSIGHLGVHMF